MSTRTVENWSASQSLTVNTPSGSGPMPAPGAALAWPNTAPCSLEPHSLSTFQILANNWASALASWVSAISFSAAQLCCCSGGGWGGIEHHLQGALHVLLQQVRLMGVPAHEQLDGVALQQPSDVVGTEAVRGEVPDQGPGVGERAVDEPAGVLAVGGLHPGVQQVLGHVGEVAAPVGPALAGQH